MRTIGFRGRVETPAAPPPPDWWGPVFDRRQRRLRTRLLKMLGRTGPMATAAVRYHAPQYEPEEVEYALAGLAVDGLLDAERRTEPRRYGGREMREYTYWRPAAPPAREG